MIRRIGVAALFAVTFVANAEAKTVKACDDEYKAQKPAIQASGEKKTDFITRCRADTAATTPLDGGAAPSAKSEPGGSCARTATEDRRAAAINSGSRSAHGVANTASSRNALEGRRICVRKRSEVPLPRRHGRVGQHEVQRVSLRRYA